jgi:hypothetical protein
MVKRVLFMLITIVLSACIVKTDELEGPPGDAGPPGSPGVSPFMTNPDGSIYYNGGNVGIGTTNPTYSAAGPVLLVKSSSAGLDGALVLENDTGTTTALYTGRSGASFSGQGVLESEGSILLIPGQGSAVGIETIGPSGSIIGDTVIGGAQDLFPGTSPAIANDQGIRAQSALHLGTAGLSTPVITVTGGGSVGIGTSNPDPTMALTVNGLVKMQSAGGETLLQAWDTDASDTVWSMGQSSFNVFDGNQLGILTKHALPIEFATNNTQRMMIAANGNVGIGTPAPGTMLDVVVGGMPNNQSDFDMRLVDSATPSNNCLLSLQSGSAGVAGVTFGAPADGDLASVRFFNDGPSNDRLALFNHGERVSVLESGDVGIGTATPQRTLSVLGSIGYSGMLYTGPNPDIAENITASDPSIEPASVVSADPLRGERVVLAARPYDTTVLGVISTHPGILLNGEEADVEAGHARDPMQRALALAGRVPVKVTLEGGPIRPGDLLTSSSVPGHAMRAVEPWRGGLLGTALTAFGGEGDAARKERIGTVVVFLALERAPSCDPSVERRFEERLQQQDAELRAEREARLRLEERLAALERRLDRP